MRNLLPVAWTVLCGVAIAASDARSDETEIPLDKLPAKALAAVKARYPQGEIVGATKEMDGKDLMYAVYVKEGGKQIDVILNADGEIEVIEKEIEAKDLPKPVSKTLEKNYPKATIVSVEAIYEVEDGKEDLEYYELELITADKKEIEVKIKPKGKIISDDDEKQDAQDEKKK
jgi:hypothetical protein